MAGPCVVSSHVQIYVVAVAGRDSRQQRSSRILVVADDFNAPSHARSRLLGMLFRFSCPGPPPAVLGKSRVRESD